MAAIEACTRTWALVRLAASEATSVSRMRDSAAEKPEICDCARLIAYCSLFWPAPILPCTEPRFVTAVVRELSAVSAFAVAEDPAVGVVAAVEPWFAPKTPRAVLPAWVRATEKAVDDWNWMPPALSPYFTAVIPTP